MAYEQKDMTGITFKNDKQGVENRPDTTGTCVIDGVKYYKSGWVNKPEGKQAYIKWTYKRADAPAGTGVDSRSSSEILDDGIIF